jgi:hypothetical protein
MAPLISVFNTDYLLNVLTTMTDKVQPPLLLHVGAVDSWPMDLGRRQSAAMIFNTDYTNEPGEHWVAVFIDGPQQVAYTFDSLPSRPFPQNVLHKLGQFCISVRDTNPQRHQLQQPDFPLCGLYCLTFLDHFSKHKPFLLCPNNQLSNDLFVLCHVLPFIVATFEK